MSLARREAWQDWRFLPLDAPSGAPPVAPPPPDADGNARTAHAWATARAHATLLAETFGEPPAGASWGFTEAEREVQRGASLHDSRYEYFAAVTLGLLYDPADAEACAFAERVRANGDLRWP
jgi:hypothetical protein